MSMVSAATIGVYSAHLFDADRSKLDAAREGLGLFLQPLDIVGVAASIDRKGEALGKKFHRTNRRKGVLILRESSDIEEPGKTVSGPPFGTHRFQCWILARSSCRR